MFLGLGKEGYRKVQQDRYDTAQFIAGRIAEMGPFEMIHNGRGNGIPAISWRLKKDANVPFMLYDLADILRTRGWLVPAYSMPPNDTDMVIQRILVRHGFSRDMAELLLTDMGRMIERFEHHPVTSHLSEAEAGGANHSGRGNPSSSHASA